MTVAAMRNKLMHYLQDASEEKLNALFVLLENELEEHEIVLSDEELAILEEEHTAYLTGKDKGKPWREVLDEIRNKPQ